MEILEILTPLALLLAGGGITILLVVHRRKKQGREGLLQDPLAQDLFAEDS